MHTQMVAQYIRKVSNSDTVESLKVLSSNLSEQKNDIFHKIEDTCPAPSPIRRLNTPSGPPETSKDSSTEENIRAFLRSKEADNIKRFASKKGLGADVDVDSIFEKVLSSFSGEKTHEALKTNIDERVSKAFEEPEMRDFVEQTLASEINKSGHAGKLAAKLLESSIDPQTRHLNHDSLRDTISKLQNMRENSKQGLMPTHRDLQSEGCMAIIATIKDFMKVCMH